MNNKPYGELYTITCTVTGKIYVGQTTQGVGKRWADHRKSARRAPGIKGALAKYGPGSFIWSVVDTAETQGELDRKEQDLIRALGTLAPNGYNLTEGGSGGKKSAETRARMSASLKKNPPKVSREGKERTRAAHLGRKHSTETRARMSAAQKGKPKTWSPGVLERISEAAKNRVPSPETRAKMSAAQKARWAEGGGLSPEAWSRVEAAKTGRKMTPESVDKIRVKATGRGHSEETRAKISQIKRAWWAVRKTALEPVPELAVEPPLHDSTPLHPSGPQGAVGGPGRDNEQD